MTSEEKCYRITGSFEGSGGFANLTGNFDGEGISFGILQWNLGQGTLQPLLKEMQKNGPQIFRQYCSVNGVDYSKSILSVMDMKPARAVEWSKSIQHNNKLNQVYKTIFARLGSNDVFNHIQMKFAENGPMAQAKKDMELFGFKTERALAFCFDVAVQNGGLGHTVWLMVDHKKPEKEVLVDCAKAIASLCRKQYQKDVLSRKLCIANGRGFVHGKAYDLKRDFGLTDEVLK